VSRKRSLERLAHASQADTVQCTAHSNNADAGHCCLTWQQDRSQRAHTPLWSVVSSIFEDTNAR